MKELTTIKSDSFFVKSFYLCIFAVGTTELSDEVAILLLPLDWDVPWGAGLDFFHLYVSYKHLGFCRGDHHYDSLHMNVRLGWDDLEGEAD